MGRRLTEVLILCMAWLGQWLAAIKSLAFSGPILLYSLAWNDALSSGLENCPARILWKDHTILYNQLNASSISSALTVSPVYRGSMLEMASSYSCLGDNQTVAISIKPRERLMLSHYDLRPLYHQEFAVLVWNNWSIRVLKERGKKRDKISRVNIYASKNVFYSREGYFQPPPPPSSRTIY